MSISSISGVPALSSLRLVQDLPKISDGLKADQTGFGEKLGDAIKNLVKSQDHARASAKAFEAGKAGDLASVMIDQQVSSLGFQLAVNVRNKALGAYRDIMNMPV